MSIDFAQGFNVITGETGAGKSILLGALGLLFGARADKDSLLNEEVKCIIEAEFKIKDYHLKEFFELNDIDYQDDTIIRREISPNGKSRAFVNDSPVNLSTLKDLSELLVDVHSQHQTLILGKKSFSFGLIDSFSKIKREVEEYQFKFHHWKKLLSNLEELKDSLKKQKKESDYNLFILNELEELQLKEDEINHLEEELKLLSQSDDLKNDIGNAVFILRDNENSLLDQLNIQVKILSKYHSIGGNLSELIGSITENASTLKENIFELEDFIQRIDVNGERLQEVNDRINIIRKILAKHNLRNQEDLNNLLDELKRSTSDFITLENNIADLEFECTNLEAELNKLASNISNLRQSNKPELEVQLINLFKEANLPEAIIEFQFNPANKLTEYGTDEVKLLFSANKGIKLSPIENAASGGELSRVMLCFKSILAKYGQLPTLVFDEIDTGISGETAIKIGKLIKNISQNHQILMITHLPQIAAMGSNHYLVFKDNLDGINQTQIKKLNTSKERVDILTMMLGGQSASELVRKNAEEMLTNH